MKIYVDADACPAVIKNVLLRAVERISIHMVFVANVNVNTFQSNYVSSIVVPQGPDIADDKIVELVEQGDLVITEDIPLADRVSDKGAVVITQRGNLCTKENIKERLAIRDLLEDLRNNGINTAGPSTFSQKDRHTFANQLDRYLTKYYKN